MSVRRFIPARAMATDDEPLITAVALATAIGTDNDTAQRLYEVSLALVNRYAPDAPDAMRREAVIRCAGWLLEAPSAGVRRSSTGPIDTAYTPAATGALRSSGAMALLSPWKVRRAGVIA